MRVTIFEIKKYRQPKLENQKANFKFSPKLSVYDFILKPFIGYLKNEFLIFLIFNFSVQSLAYFELAFQIDLKLNLMSLVGKNTKNF